MSWTWRLEAADGTVLTTPAAPTHSSQSDAESWVGENWRELADVGVAQVTLLEDSRVEYGPMPLSES